MNQEAVSFFFWIEHMPDNWDSKRLTTTGCPCTPDLDSYIHFEGANFAPSLEKFPH